ncbi:azurocidin-like [Convolutriloba macropyga]|uniref:azurocidin-like n=1 Tax=Convolutriloba macropyga TaxID=536237 RepID=UPI003F524FC0
MIHNGSTLHKRVLNDIINGKNVRMRSFFATISDFRGLSYCGAAIIQRRWAVTAASCVIGRAPHAIVLGFNRFSAYRERRNNPKTRFVQQVFLHDGFVNTAEYRNNIALLKFRNITDLALSISPSLIIPICREKLCLLHEGREPLGVCGMGSVSRQSYEIRSYFTQEAIFFETSFADTSRQEIEFCREENVCVESATELDVSICHYDTGSPLYTFETCNNTLRPKCLYGIASFYRNVSEPNGNHHCNDGSFFTSIVYFHDWIVRTIANN